MSPQDHAEDLAKELRGNWRKFESFGWHERPEDAEEWCIVYTSNRDSGLVDQSNAAAIEKIMGEFPETECIAQSHNHWACGYVDGYAIRISNPDGSFTGAFLAWRDIVQSLEEYPLLDDSDHSEREYEGACENIASECRYDGFEPGQEYKIFGWLSDNEQEELESRDDHAPYPSREAVERAAVALGFMVSEDDEDEEDDGNGFVEGEPDGSELD